MRAVNLPASTTDHVAALRVDALNTTNRIVAALGTPLILWGAWSVWPESRALSLGAGITAAFITLPVTLPLRFVMVRQVSPVIGLAWVSVLSWIINGAFSTPGLLLWSTAIVAAIAIGRRAAIGIVVGSCLLLLSAPLTQSEWVLPIAARASDPLVLTRFVLAFGILTATTLSVAWGVITPLERSLAAATGLVHALRREHRARAALDVRLMQNDEDMRLGIARRLQQHLRARLTSLERSLTKAGEYGGDAGARVVDNAVMGIGQLIEHVRMASRQLRPVLLDDAGLAPALDFLAKSELGRNAIPYDVDIDFQCKLAPAMEVACYRIVQEAVDNIVQHAQATRARLTARCHAHEMELTVEDNGIGFDVQQVLSRDAPTMGLFAMRRRADALGATLHIESAANRGTRVNFMLPLVNSR